jgi:hypothetical protein
VRSANVPVLSILGSTSSSLRGAWLLAVFWNLVSSPLLVVLPREIERKPVAAIGVLFPAVGVGLLAWAGLDAAPAPVRGRALRDETRCRPWRALRRHDSHAVLVC